jgi:hypothetical protein
VTLKFVTPEALNEPIVIECPSGEQLRACMLENKVWYHSTHKQQQSLASCYAQHSQGQHLTGTKSSACLRMFYTQLL